MNNRANSIIFLIIGLVIGGLVMHFCGNYKVVKNNSAVSDIENTRSQSDNIINPTYDNGKIIEYAHISQLTIDSDVIDFVKKKHKLPDFYITKSEARKLGWNPSAGNLCEVLPGKAIGGDKFSNREKSLPLGSQYFEADVNFNCGNRGADRIIFTKNGEVWLTKDHYKSFSKQ